MKYFPAVIYQQLSRKYGAKELFLNFNAMGSQGIYQTFKQNSWKIKKTKLFLTASIHLGPKSMLVYPKVLFYYW